MACRWSSCREDTSAAMGILTRSVNWRVGWRDRGKRSAGSICSPPRASWRGGTEVVRVTGNVGGADGWVSGA